jgi:hypothetical protein
MSDYPITSAAGQRIMSYVPGYYETSRVFRALAQARGAEIDKLRQALDETLNQFFARTATWGLDDWEEELGLAPQPGFTDQERQDRIVSKLRGYGTCTIGLTEQVAEAYDQGAIDAIQDHTIYQVTIRFVDTTGVPPNIDDLKIAAREVVPAHLGLVFEYNYLIWDEWDAMNLTWDQQDAQAKTWDQLEVWT